MRMHLQYWTAGLLFACAALAMAPAEAYAAQRQAGDTFRDCDDCPELVVIPAGKFIMGRAPSDAEKARMGHDDVIPSGPVHEVAFPGKMAIGKYAVTRGQYMACVKANVCALPAWQVEGSPEHHLTGSRKYIYNHFGIPEAGDDTPIVGIDWHDAQKYLQWLEIRTGQLYLLPNEAQWEYAARAGGEVCKGCEFDPELKNLPLRAVNAGKPNAFGLHACSTGFRNTCRNAGIPTMSASRINGATSHGLGAIAGNARSGEFQAARPSWNIPAGGGRSRPAYDPGSPAFAW